MGDDDGGEPPVGSAHGLFRYDGGDAADQRGTHEKQSEEGINHVSRIDLVSVLPDDLSVLRADEAVNAVREEQQEEHARKQLVYNEKDSNGDDPIRLYLREIGKEHLLTAEQEVILSKRMENGENIIKNVIKNSGMMIPEF